MTESTRNRFLLTELIKRDFIKKYKRTTLGILWSALAPLLLLITMDLVFGTFFGNKLPHYTIYLFSGLLLFNYFSGITRNSMTVLYNSAPIYSKVPVPKLYFLISRNVAHFIDFLVSLVLYFVFVAIDGIAFKTNFLLLIYPIVCLFFINFGICMLLSSLYIFLHDISYLWPVICRVIMYSSAIFYDVSILPGTLRRLLQCNPLYMCIDYFRQLVIHSTVPSASYHVILFVMTLLCLAIGGFTYYISRDKIVLYV